MEGIKPMNDKEKEFEYREESMLLAQLVENFRL